MTDVERVTRMSRKEINAEVIHLMREQEEYEQKLTHLHAELERVAGIINRIADVVHDITEDHPNIFGEVEKIHWLILEAVGHGLRASDYATLDEIAKGNTSMVGYVEIGGTYLRKQDVKGKTEQQIKDMLAERRKPL
ncbi:hypothetical protein AAC03nite_19920 [Alicyclobacillus acidoterrestris]|nr:hypothetical protein AAC03nite_19920 [Alicyclobacillus acidoterrestris]